MRWKHVLNQSIIRKTVKFMSAHMTLCKYFKTEEIRMVSVLLLNYTSVKERELMFFEATMFKNVK